MSIGAGKKVSFVAGLMLLFPGYVFLAYSLHPSLRLSSNGLCEEAVRDAVAATAEPWTGPMPENVIVFPQRPFGRGPTPPGYRSYR
jgi:hypothetical protein